MLFLLIRVVSLHWGRKTLIKTKDNCNLLLIWCHHKACRGAAYGPWVSRSRSHGLNIENRASVVGEHTFERNNCNRLASKETLCTLNRRRLCSPTRVIIVFGIRLSCSQRHLSPSWWWGVHATFSSAALPTSHCAYKALFSTRTLGTVAVCFAVAFHQRL